MPVQFDPVVTSRSLEGRAPCTKRGPPPAPTPTLTPPIAPRGLTFVEQPAATPKAVPDPLIVDATVVDRTLFMLDEQGGLSARALGQSHACALPITPPPEPVTSLYSVGKQLVVLGKQTGRLYSTQPCHGNGTWKPQTLAASTRQVALALDRGGLTHLSTSPDGQWVWAQNATYGQLFAPIADGSTWAPVDPPKKLGQGAVRRIIRDRSMYVDVLGGKAVVNGQASQVFDAPYIAFIGGTESAVRSRGAEAHPTLPNVVESDKTRRVAPGLLITFPVEQSALIGQL